MTAWQIVLLLLAALLVSGAAAGLLISRMPPTDLAVDDGEPDEGREESDEVTLPSGVRYRLTLDQLEVWRDGAWAPADQVDAEDVVALMRWYAWVDL